MDLLTNIYQKLGSTTSITDIVWTRIFKRIPTDSQSGSYIYFNRKKRTDDEVSAKWRIQFTLLSKDLQELEVLSKEIRNLFFGKTTKINDFWIISSRFLGQNDYGQPTNEKFYINTVDIEVFYIN